MTAPRCVVTGGGGFIGAHLVRALVRAGWRVNVVDNMARGDSRRFSDVADDVELFICDVRNSDALLQAFEGAEVAFHLAAVNGTENFYKHPELVLDVGLRGALAVVEACKAQDVPHLVVASSAEAYQTPTIVPTDETIPLMLPSSLNPRYAYGGSKIASELIAFNYGQDHFEKVQVFRPHNVYGPDMGWKHVVPQFISRALELQKTAQGGERRPFPIQGDGLETRAFAYIDDVVDGILLMQARGAHRTIYHIGNDEEVSIRDLVSRITDAVGIDVDIVSGPPAIGGTPRRCPSIDRLRKLGYSPHFNLSAGIAKTVSWYESNFDARPANELM